MALRTGVIYLQKDKLQIYSPYAGTIMEMKFGTDMIRDLDVVSLELVETTVKSFITAGKIPPIGLVIVLADNAYFTKDFVQPAVQKTGATAITAEVTKEILHNQAEQFVEHVPFDNVVSKTIPLKNGIRVCATNKDFYESLAAAFEHNGFSLVSVIPALVLGGGFGAQPVLTPAMAGSALSKVNTLKEFDLLNQQVYQPEIKQDTEEIDEVALEKQQTKKPSKKQIYLVIGIFVILVVLIVVMVMQFTAPPPKHASQTTTPASSGPASAVQQPVVTASTPTVSVSSSASLSAVKTNTLKVQILNASDAAPTAQVLREKLSQDDFKSVTSQTQNALGSSSTLVSFNPETTQAVRDVVLSAVRQVKSNITVQDKSNSAYDITIILGE